jgi:murein L,D-transpeptidase YcbB/YkuD
MASPRLPPLPRPALRRDGRSLHGGVRNHCARRLLDDLDHRQARSLPEIRPANPRRIHPQRLLVAASIVGALLTGAGAAAAYDLDQVPSEIDVLVKRAAPMSSRDALEQFYEPGNHAPAWFDAGGPKPEATTALVELAAAPVHGLNPSDYEPQRLAEVLRSIGRGDPASLVAQTDVALTQAMLRYLVDLHAGRIAPETVGFRLPTRGAFDAPARLREALSTGRIPDAVAAAEPSLAIYARLAHALARYRELARHPLAPLPSLPSGARSIAPGERYAGTYDLHERLRMLGDIPLDAPLPAGERYDGAVVVGVRSFQERHGLAPDGVLGPATLRELGVPLAARVRQIALGMERLRWLPQLRPGPTIAVNVPSYTLWAFDTADTGRPPALTMSVIVGRAGPRLQTPIFVGQMRSVEFSPFWNVPRDIVREEYLPKLARDPSLLARQDMEIVSAGPAASPVATVDAATLTLLERGELRLRQRPGNHNALGGVKFVLPNTMNVYLHGTPARQLFARTQRDFSHGCIRVADPLALARFVLRDRPEWTVERMRDAIAAGQPAAVALPEPVPVVIFYTTVIVASDGRVFFLPDLYGHDLKLARALRAARGSADLGDSDSSP